MARENRGALATSNPADQLYTAGEVAALLAAQAASNTATYAALGQVYSQPTVTLTATGTLAAGAPNALDATSGSFTATLPTPTKVGQLVVLERIDLTTNTITIAAAAGATIRGNAAATIPMPGVGAAYEGLSFISESLTSWRPGPGHKPKAWLDAVYAPYNQGRRVVTEFQASVSGSAVPSGIVGCLVTICAAGGGGGSGRRGAAGTLRCGGGGGGSGGTVIDYWFPAASLGTTFSATVGAAGTGGAAVTANDTSGAAGTTGGTTSFSSGSAFLQAIGGVGGSGGSALSGSGGAAGNGMFVGASGASASTAGGVATTSGLVPGPASGAGGAGGGISTADAASAGGPAGGPVFVGGGASTNAGGVVGGATPTPGSAGATYFGPGGGGGAASITAAAQAGAGQYSSVRGSGGGGGGASLNGYNSGAGGNGAQGFVRVTWIYG